MSGIANAPRITLRQPLHPEDTLFLSPHKSLLARGRIASLTEPAGDGHLASSTFQLRLQQLFEQARHAGVENPIVIGAIPFDKSQPSALYAPAEYHWLDRTAIAAAPAAAQTLAQGARRLQPDHDEFCRMVSAALRQLKRDELQKVVLSRLLHIELPQPQSALRLWQRLNRQNPASYNFHLPLADGVLIGASPELLLRKRGERIDSMPLAGSARRSADAAQDMRLRAALLASRKDRHEHQIVADAIRRQLAERCRSLTLPEPELISTPTLWHLATRVQGCVRHPQENALSLACLLHPTPALCGAPCRHAHALIQRLEPFRRGWFGGIVGWCNAQGDGEWVVTIRCGHIQPQRITLFAGAGIVPDSQPENEWYETGVKLGTMLQALGCAQLQEAS
ncbi:Isochorismate synthase EntC [Mixta theicola]|nr:isochorismate synthase [Mixta theicola]QHM74829.1 Isochorismate synthase EntC [Mixta theicola]